MSSYSESFRPSTHGSITPSSPSIAESDETAVDSNVQSPSRACSACQKCKLTIDYDDTYQTPLETCHGWPKLTELMVETPGFESFQTFRDLNIKSLLYYQAELCSLRQQLHKLEWKDHRTGKALHAEDFCANIKFLIDSEGESKKRQEQIVLVKKIRVVLKEYNKALLQYSQINELPAADEFIVDNLHTWLIDPKLGGGLVRGPGQESWGDLGKPDAPKPFKAHLIRFLRSLTIFWAEEPPKTNHPGLVVPRKVKEIDGFTRWVANDWVPFWHRLRGKLWEDKEHTERKEKGLPTNIRSKQKRRHSSRGSDSSSLSLWLSRLRSPPEPDTGDTSEEGPTLTTYHMSRMHAFTSFVTTIVACLLPTAAIAILATIHSEAKIIGFIALFTAIFAMGLMGLTNSGTSRTDIFTATAAFSAVLVVFVQNQQQCSQ